MLLPGSAFPRLARLAPASLSRQHSFGTDVRNFQD